MYLLRKLSTFIENHGKVTEKLLLYENTLYHKDVSHSQI